MAEAWLLAMLTVTFGVGVVTLATGRRGSAYDWALALAAASRRLSSQLFSWGRVLGRHYLPKLIWRRCCF